MSISPETLIPALIFGVVLTLVPLILAAFSGARRAQTRKVNKIAGKYSAGKATKAGEGLSLMSETVSAGFMGQIERSLLRFLPRPAVLRLKLIRAGLDLSPGRFATLAATFGVLTGMAVVASGRSGLLAILIGVVAAIGGSNFWLARRIAKRKKQFVTLFPEAVDLMVRGLKSGVPVTQTIISVGTEIRDPVGAEFRRVADSAALGVTLIDALWEAANRVDTTEFRFFVVAITIQRETGGNLGETLENLSDILRKRLQMQLKVKALSSEARSSAMIIGALPFAMFGILMALNPAYAMKLINDPRGMMMLGVGLFLMFLGGFLMSRMVKFEI